MRGCNVTGIKVPMMLTRIEFAQHFDRVSPGKMFGSSSSPLWIPEDNCNTRCEWFISVKPVIMQTDASDKSDFWLWCSTNLAGIVRCFASDSYGQVEWWGFEKREDIEWWILKWS